VLLYAFLSTSAQDQKQVDSLLQAAEQTSDPKEQVDLYVSLASLHQRNDSTTAFAYARKAIDIAKQIDYRGGIIGALQQMAWTLLNYMNTDQAERLFLQAHGIADEFDMIEEMGVAQLGLGWVCFYRGQYEKANDSFQESLLMVDSASLPRVHSAIGQTYVRLGQLQKAEAIYLEGIALARRVGDKLTETVLLRALANAYRRQGNYPRALDYLFQSLELRKEVNDQHGVVITYQSIGQFYISLGEYDQALHYVYQGLEISKTFENQELLAYDYCIVAESYAGKQAHDSAIIYLKKAMQIAEQLAMNTLLADVYIDLGDSYFQLGRLDEALEAQHKVEKMRQATTEDAKTKIYAAISKIYLAQGKLTDARIYSQRALDSALDAEAPDTKIGSFKQHAEVEKALGNYRSAHKYLELYKHLEDSIENDETTKKIARIEADFANKAEKDSIRFTAELERATLEQEISNRKRTQWISYLGIGLLAGVLLTLYNFYRSKKKANAGLQELNNTIKAQNSEIKSQRDHLEDTLQELKITQDNMVRTEKMASLGILIAGIGHEINNPLNFIHQSVMALSMKLKRGIIDPNKDEIREFDGISEGIKRIADIVTSLRRFSRETKVMDEPCNVADIMEGCLNILQSKIRKKELAINKDGPKDPPIAYGNEGKLHQAFLNFLSNAIDASDIGGAIHLAITAEAGQLIATIRDEGTGMDAATLKKLGDPFFTTKDPGEGTGLGIYISRDIIEAHRGKVSYESTLGSGTTVTLTLPTHTPVVLKVTRRGE